MSLYVTESRQHLQTMFSHFIWYLRRIVCISKAYNTIYGACECTVTTQVARLNPHTTSISSKIYLTSPCFENKQTTLVQHVMTLTIAASDTPHRCSPINYMVSITTSCTLYASRQANAGHDTLDH